jgi:serine/threonine-protein kinase
VSLSPGTRLGPYDVVSLLGAGGMGEVYSARDTRLERHVALKLVLDAFVTDRERTLRFEQEARTLASLNHPNIATLHGIEHTDGRHFLVMEFVDGETLADRIARHPGGLPVDEALHIARQIADALEAAHERGIVHRDLKPANIKVTPDDTIKVLDFGLAKAMSGAVAVAGADINNSPTFTSPATELGLVLGTAAYMAPEQARGKPVDKRADIWAFGVVLFEMLSGVRLFAGDTVSDTIAAVLTRELTFDLLPPGVPPHVRQLLRRCLERDPRRRLRDIGDARSELEPTGIAPASPSSAPPAAVRGGRVGVWTAGALGAGLLVALAALWEMRTAGPAAPVIQFDVPAPAGATLQLSSRPAVAVSPDGSMLAITASNAETSRLYLRARGEVDLRAIPGTEGASDPAFSPDGRWIAFVTPAELVKVSLDGRTRVALAPVVDPRGLGWLDDQTIIVSREVALGLSLVQAGGGPVREVTAVDTAQAERTHRWPAVVPGGKAVLFTVGTEASPDDYNDARIDAVVVATGERKKVLDGASMVRVTADGRLLFVRQGVLYSASFDPDQLQVSGDPSPVLPGVEGDLTTGASHFSISSEGTIAYVPGLTASGRRRLTWRDRTGKASPIDIPPAVFNEPAISPDGRRIAVVVGTVGRADIWTYDIDRRLFSRLTLEGKASTPYWSADSQSIYYMNVELTTQQSTLMRRRVDGSGDAAALATVAGRAHLGYVDPGEQAAIVMIVQPASANNSGIFRLPIAAPGPAQALIDTPALEYAPAVSPDRRWLAYVSTASGVQEVWVRDMTGAGQWQISTAGGLGPRWSADGQELFFRRGEVQMVVPIEATPAFRAGQERALFPGAFNWRTEAGMNYTVDHTTGRFLMILPPSADSPETRPTVRVIVNWPGGG